MHLFLVNPLRLHRTYLVAKLVLGWYVPVMAHRSCSLQSAVGVLDLRCISPAVSSQDTPGFHPEASLGVANTIVAHIVRQSELYLDAECDPSRSVPQWEIPDTRVDACLFLLPREEPGPATLAFLRTLGQLLPVIPILAKVRVGLCNVHVHYANFMPSSSSRCS